MSDEHPDVDATTSNDMEVTEEEVEATDAEATATTSNDIHPPLNEEGEEQPDEEPEVQPVEETSDEPEPASGAMGAPATA